MAPATSASLPIFSMPSVVPESAPIVTGIGVATGFGYGKEALRAGLFTGRNVFDVMHRPGRQNPDWGSAYVGIEVPDPPTVLAQRVARTTGLTGLMGAAVLDEAWREADLGGVDPTRIGLVVGGSNLQSREHLLTGQAYATRPAFMPPRQGCAFLDTDLCGLWTSAFDIRGFAYTVGGASASGALAVLHAAEAVRSGRVDACIAIGALQDLSSFDCQALSAVGAMGSERFAGEPARACRPFDRGRDGFIFGESCAALVIRKNDGGSAGERNYGSITGGAHIADGTRGPNPSLEGEVRVIHAALAAARLRPDEVDYLNAHATGTPLGDDTEVAAYHATGLTRARINATKSIIGHGLSSAGAVEMAAVLLQMRDRRLHPTRNLDDPIDPGLLWVTGAPEDHTIRNALKLSFGFGGINVALVVRSPEEPHP